MPRALNMPRSFLVKKVKLDDFSCAELESAYGRSRSDLNLRIHEKGKLNLLSLSPPASGLSELSTLYSVNVSRQNQAVLL